MMMMMMMILSHGITQAVSESTMSAVGFESNTIAGCKNSRTCFVERTF